MAGTTFLSKIKSLWHEVTAYFTSGLRWDVLLLSWYREIFCCIAADWILGSKFGYEISSAGARSVHDGSDRVSERGARTPSARRARARSHTRAAPAHRDPLSHTFLPGLEQSGAQRGPRGK